MTTARSTSTATTADHGVVVALAFLAAASVTARGFRESGMGDDAAWSLLAYALIGGLVGAKACYVALHGPGALLSRAGMVWYGGLVGGALAVAWAIRRQHLPFRPSWQTSEEEADAPDGMWVFVRPAHFGAPKGRLSSRAG